MVVLKVEVKTPTSSDVLRSLQQTQRFSKKMCSREGVRTGSSCEVEDLQGHTKGTEL